MQKFNLSVVFSYFLLILGFNKSYADPLTLQIIEPNGETATLSLDEWEARQQIHCQQLLDYIYRELTIRNLEKSYERLTKKLLLAYITLYQNAEQGDMESNAPLVYLTNSLKNLDPDFERVIAEHRTAPSSRALLQSFGPLPSRSNFHAMILDWRRYQQTHPQIFTGLNSQYFLDDWDIAMSGVLDQVDTLAPNNRELSSLARRFHRPDLIGSGRPLPNPVELMTNIDQTGSEIMDTVNQIYLDATTEYRDYCDQDALTNFLGDENTCSVEQNLSQSRSELLGQLNELARLVQSANIASIPEAPVVAQITDRSALLDIIRPNYITNPRANYCARNMDIVDTIIIHHTATPPTTTATEINETHIERSTNNDNWYMIGYNYIINGSYADTNPTTDSTLTITQGRPENIIGAHAGGFTRSISDETREIMQASPVSCGTSEGVRTISNAVQHINRRRQINANFNSIGIALVGNYSPQIYRRVGGVLVLKNETGYPTGPNSRVRYPSTRVLQKLAQLMCDIQKRNPRVTIFKPHRYFTSTECPGNIHAKFEEIKNYAKELGCEFSF